jgi:hypothetical protein
MYTLRQFMRMNGVSGQDVEQFVAAVSDEGLSVRQIEQLAHGYFCAFVRSAYQEGFLTDPPDLSIYQDQSEQNHE